MIRFSVIALSLGLSGIAHAKDQTLATGQLTLDAALQQKATGIKTLFIVIYDEASKRPMPFGATKVMLDKDAKGKFHKFELTTKNVRQMGHGPLPQTMRIKARLDKDGSAGMDTAGDLVGEVKGVKKGATDITIAISEAK